MLYTCWALLLAPQGADLRVLHGGLHVGPLWSGGPSPGAVHLRLLRLYSEGRSPGIWPVVYKAVWYLVYSTQYIRYIIYSI